MLTSVLAFSSLLSNPGIPANGSDLKQRVEQLERDRATMEETMVRMRRHITQLESTVDGIHGFEQIGAGYRISTGGSTLELTDGGVTIEGAASLQLNASTISIGGGSTLELTGGIITLNGANRPVAGMGDYLTGLAGPYAVSGQISQGSSTVFMGN